MMTLDDSWRWYETTRGQLGLVGRLGAKYWDSLPWEGPLGKDTLGLDLSTLTAVISRTFPVRRSVNTAPTPEKAAVGST